MQIQAGGKSVLLYQSLLIPEEHENNTPQKHAGGWGGEVRACLQPAVSVNDDRVVRQGLDTILNEFDDPVSIALGLLQLGSGDPDGRLCGDCLASSVEHLLGVLVALEAGQRQPKLYVLHANITIWVLHILNVSI